MESINKKISVTTIAVFFLIFATLFVFQCSLQKNDIIELQKKILVAKTAEQKQRILAQLDEYYLTLTIPDSIQQHVQFEVDSLIIRWATEVGTNVVNNKHNIYDLENQLKETLHQLKIARVLGKESVSKALSKKAKILATAIDSSTNNDYWCPWVEKVASFDSSKAMNWLLAHKADQLCRNFSTNESLLSEKYGAFALQQAEHTEDARLLLDITQRQFYVLYRIRELYDLSYLYAKRGIQEATGLKYHLRTTGFLHNYAEALYMAGRIKEALETYLEIIKTTEKYNQIRGMSWYEKNAKIGAAKTNCDLGNYEQTLSLGRFLEKQELNSHQKIQLYNYKANAHRGLGNYDMAKENYDKSLGLCVNDSKQYMKVIVLNNLAEFFNHLTEYEKATKYFTEAMRLHEKKDSQNIVRKIRLLISFAETKAGQNKIDEFIHVTKEANSLIQLINVPSLKASVLRSLGRMNNKSSKYDLAYQAFENAISVYEKNGLYSAALETECDLVDCLSGLEKYKRANDLIDKILKNAKKINDEQCIIDALGKKAEIAHKQGNLNEAIQISNQLINGIESLSARITNSDNLIYFRQKIHAYLQNTVFYEIQKGRKDSAFIKLDYMKARALKNRRRANNNKMDSENKFSYAIDIENLKMQLSEKEWLINYFVTSSALYAFVLNRKNLQLLKISLSKNELNRVANAYISSIDETIKVLGNHQPNLLVAHYDSVTALGNKLYNSILGGSMFSPYLKDIETIYFIPDDILYGIPFSNLVISNQDVPQYLIQRTAIVNLPSAALLQSRKNEIGKQSVEEKKVLCAIDWNLPGARTIFNKIKKQFPLVEKLKANKNDLKKEDVLLQLNQDYDIYIFVGHSVSNTRTPELSFIELSVINQSNSTVNNFVLNLDDLKKINWSRAEKVFLFGCETALGKAYKGSGLVGLQQGIVLSGAQEVLASLWRIDANQTKAQIVKLFKSLSQNNNTALALQDMQKSIIQDLNKNNYYKRAHPYIWGSYTLLKMVN